LHGSTIEIISVFDQFSLSKNENIIHSQVKNSVKADEASSQKPLYFHDKERKFNLSNKESRNVSGFSVGTIQRQ